jgi:hypothetical protein
MFFKQNVTEYYSDEIRDVLLYKIKITLLWRTYINCISVRNPLLCLPSNPPVMYGRNPPNILTPVYKSFWGFIVPVCYEPS